MPKLFKLFLILLAGIILSAGLMVFFSNAQTTVKNLFDKRKTGAAIQKTFDAQLARPEVQKTLEDAATQISEARSISSQHFLPEYNLFVFSTQPKPLSLAKDKLNFYTPDDAKNLLYSLPLSAYSAPSHPVILEDGHGMKFARLSEETGKNTTLYAVKLDTVPSGKYQILIKDSVSSNGIYSSIILPERHPILKVSLVSKPINTTIGKAFTLKLSVQNTALTTANNVPLDFYLSNQQLLTTIPKIPVKREKDKYRLLIPAIPAKKSYPVEVQFKAIAHDPEIWFSTRIDHELWIHPEQEIQSIGKVIGKITPGNFSPSTADPAILLNEKRWDFCRANQPSGDAMSVKSCARQKASEDFACLTKPSKQAQHECIKSIYPN